MAEPRASAGHVSATKDWVDLAIKAEIGPVLARLHGMDRALELSHATLTTRLEHANGILKQMGDDRETLARKESLAALALRTDKLEQFRSALEGDTAGSRRAAQPMNAFAMTLVASIIAAVVAYIAARFGI